MSLKSSALFILLFVHAAFLQAQVTTPEREKEMEEVHIILKSKKQRGKEVMKKVIAQREFYEDQLKNYSVETYCFTSLDQEIEDTIPGNINETQRIDQLEWSATSYYKTNGYYKDVFHGYLDYSGQSEISGNSGIANEPNFLGEESISNSLSISSNPYVFIKGLKDADINLYKSQLNEQTITTNTIISPLADNAFLYYSFYLEKTNLSNLDSIVYEIQVAPIFNEEALFKGTIWIKDKSWEILNYDLTLNRGGMEFFKSMQITGNYRLINNVLVPTARTFNYSIKEGKKYIFGKSTITYKDYQLSSNERENKFWNETVVYEPKAFNQNPNYWDSIRPIRLMKRDSLFMIKQDSISSVYYSDTAINRRDSIYNALSWRDILYKGMGFRNTYKKREIFINGLLNQYVPLGVGGQRHRLNVSHKKGFNNGKEIFLNPIIDYGLDNKDFKGEIAVKYFYNPLKLSSIRFEVGDVYDFVNSYQSFIGTWGPSNRVRNQKFEIAHRMEIANGLFLNKEFLFSNRSAITNVKYPEWVNLFGTFSKPMPFDTYKISRLTLELEYYHHQKYLIKNNQKIVLGSKWPTIGAKMQFGIPKLFGGQSNFGFLELRVSDNRKIRTLGLINYRMVFGQFVYKNDLRIIEHKYFRSSDKWLFSMPNNSLQLLDTNMNTSDAYLQCNVIHHFNGFFLNKIWGINKLKLEESVGGSLLYLPSSSFLQTEMYVGVERKVRIKKQIMKFGVYLVNANSTHFKHNYGIKFGINGFDNFTQKWLY